MQLHLFAAFLLIFLVMVTQFRAMPMNNDDDADYEMAVKRVVSWKCMSDCAQWHKCRTRSLTVETTCIGPDGCDCSQFGLDPSITET